jgi:protein-S-isoprenylcysteine O-methyltransferase Ste14
MAGTLQGHGTADRVAALASRADGKVCEKSREKRVEIAVGCIRKVCGPPPDDLLVSELQNRGWKRAGRMYTAIASDAKKELLGETSLAFRCLFPCSLWQGTITRPVSSGLVWIPLMDGVRYYLALFVVMIFPVAFCFWFSIHPFICYWRKLGAGRTYAIHLTAMGVIAAGLFVVRRKLLAVEFGTNLILIGLAALIFVFAFAVALRLKKEIGWKVMLGLPEVVPQRHNSRLVTTGLYSRVRHPRSVEALSAALACALFTNYLAVYVIVVLFLVGFPFIIRLEEKELRERFGEEYEEYCRRVPRFVPRF